MRGACFMCDYHHYKIALYWLIVGVWPQQQGLGARRITRAEAHPVPAGARSQTWELQCFLSQTFQSVDALVPPDILYQMTVCPSHGIKVRICLSLCIHISTLEQERGLDALNFTGTHDINFYFGGFDSGLRSVQKGKTGRCMGSTNWAEGDRNQTGWCNCQVSMMVLRMKSAWVDRDEMV